MKNKTSKVIAILVIVLALMVMVGWLFDITFLKSVSPDWITMKFITAICFVFSGAILYLSSENEKMNEWKGLLLAFNVYILLLIVSGIGLSVFFGIRTGLEDLFVREPKGAVFTTLPGRPSSMTLFAFLLVSIGGLFALVRKKYCKRLIFYEGVALIIIGSMALAGYILNFPPFFYRFGEDSTAMAFHTAIFFILLGIGFISI